MNAQRLRVLVVEDSLTIRRLLCETLGADPSIDVVGETDNGQGAVDLCRSLRPDIVTLDMQLPVMSGLWATEHIMAHCPTPILIVSASTNRGELFDTYDALSAGAVDIFEKPRGDASDEGWEQRFVAAVKLVAKIRVITHPRARLGLSARARPTLPASRALPAQAGTTPIGVIALGASTGGPSALVTVLRELPAALGISILLVLHIDQPFGSAFAEWLGNQLQQRVTFAAGGETLETTTNRILMAPPGRHLYVDGAHLQLSSTAERHSCRPSIDVLFESLAVATAPRTAAALLTGMGRDGAAGLLALRRAGAFTLAQDEGSSVVYGMPREAALLGAAERVLPLDEIGRALAENVQARRRATP